MIRPTGPTDLGADGGGDGGGLSPAGGGDCGAVPVSCHYAHLCPPTEPLTGGRALLREESVNGD